MFKIIDKSGDGRISF